MADVSADEIAEALVCVAKLILFLRKLEWVGDEGLLIELEDDLSELHQEAR
jgi:hypothetical protein